MPAKAASLVVTALFASVAFAQAPGEQNLDRTLHFTHTETAQDVQEIATVIGAITEIHRLSTDTDQRAVALNGTASQIALAEWLFNELDRPAIRPAVVPPSPSPATGEYRVSETGDDVVRVFYLTNTATVQQLQEVATLVRSIAGIRRLFTYNAPRAVVLRGTSDQMALAAWLFSEMDQPKNRTSTPREYRLPGSGDDVVRVFSMTHTATVQDFQEVVTLVRSVTDIRQLFTYNTPREVAARATADRMALAAWLFNELDTPVNQRTPDQQVKNSARHEYRIAGGGEDVVRVFYLTHGETVQRLQEITVEVRSITAVRRLFTYNAPKAIAMRGTASQIAMADRLIQERDK